MSFLKALGQELLEMVLFSVACFAVIGLAALPFVFFSPTVAMIIVIVFILSCFAVQGALERMGKW